MVVRAGAAKIFQDLVDVDVAACIVRVDAVAIACIRTSGNLRSTLFVRSCITTCIVLVHI